MHLVEVDILLMTPAYRLVECVQPQLVVAFGGSTSYSLCVGAGGENAGNLWHGYFI